jgi:hypothetical protein
MQLKKVKIGQVVEIEGVTWEVVGEGRCLRFEESKKFPPETICRVVSIPVLKWTVWVDGLRKPNFKGMREVRYEGTGR